MIGVARGTRRRAPLLLNGHTDTVGHDGYERPLEPRVEGDRLYGRGCFDMKGGTAAALWACAQAAELDLAGDVIVVAVCDEEFASIGTQAVAERIGADAAIVTEPTALAVCVAHKGFAWLEIDVTGRAAHGSQLQLGIDAIAKTGPRAHGHRGPRPRLAAGPGHPLLGHGLAARVADRRRAGALELPGALPRPARAPHRPGRGRRARRGAGARLVARAADADPELRAEVRTTLVRPPFEIAEDAEIVRLVRSARRARARRRAAVIGWAAWMDSAILDQAGIPTVIFGPAGEGAHETLEWVDLASVERCAEVLLAVAAEFCA